LPVGLSDLPRNFTVNVFCPRCHGLFFPKSTRQANIDGAYFGTTFPHLYLMTHPVCYGRASCHFVIRTCCSVTLYAFCPKDMIPPKPTQSYVPRVYGFKVNQSSLFYRNHEEGTQQQQIETAQRNNRKARQRTPRK
jgi:casein kinase II subunit beta